MASLKKLTPVVVEWLDILDGGGEWQQPHTTPSPVQVRTVGYIHKRNKRHIVLIRDYYDLDGHRTIGGALAIPLGCIVKITDLAPKQNEP